jgi:hypothetical protein
MKLPLTIDSQYSTTLSKDEIVGVIYNDESETSFLGMKVEYHKGGFVGDQFEILRNANGVTAFIESYPLITGWIKENPMRIRLKITPNYFKIIFFLFIGSVIFFSGIFFPEVTVNGVYKKNPSFSEWLVSPSIGILMGLWGYLNAIRPIKQTEKWVIRKLGLIKINPLK